VYPEIPAGNFSASFCVVLSGRIKKILRVLSLFAGGNFRLSGHVQHGGGKNPRLYSRMTVRLQPDSGGPLAREGLVIILLCKIIARPCSLDCSGNPFCPPQADKKIEAESPAPARSAGDTPKFFFRKIPHSSFLISHYSFSFLRLSIRAPLCIMALDLFEGLAVFSRSCCICRA
jgi:hypothetical protein